MTDVDRYEAAIARIDAANSEDPHTEQGEAGPVPKELLYSQRMSAWLQKLAPDAPDAVRLAVRAQHLCRWRIPRDQYPMDRAGYKAWRTDLARMHADLAAGILRDVGYDEETIALVGQMLRKKQLKVLPSVQLIEDVACLVFLESYFAEFASRHDGEKVIGILRKTWAKMSDRGHEEALKLDLAPAARALVEQALSGA